MEENEWLNGYLEAILDAGKGRSQKEMNESTTMNLKNGATKTRVISCEEMNAKGDKQIFSPIKYFVQGVVDNFDEADLLRTWNKVTADRNPRTNSNRLENMCWRIWHLARKNKQVMWNDTQKLVKQRLDRENGRNDAANDISDLSEGEKEKGDSSQADSVRAISRISSDTQIWCDDKPRHLYIVLISLHGLVRGQNMELGRDSDTGGQVKYVVELARALANMEGVHRVDLLTRQIASLEVDSSYGEPVEMLSCPHDGFGSGGAYIIRIPCGPLDKYIQKELLWPYIPEFVDGSLAHIVSMARALGEAVSLGRPVWPYVIHGHYADGGEAAARLSRVLNVPMVLTGHSLGRNKLEQFLNYGTLSREDINATYKIIRRIEAEELALDSAEMVVTSTRQEIEEQWGLYDGFDIQLERKLRVRKRRGASCLGRHMPRMVVIPPGMDFSKVEIHDPPEGNGDLKTMMDSDRTHKRHIPSIWSEIMRFFTNPHKPMILALSRPDPKKNITTLINAFGECQPLRQLANLTLVLGNRENIEEMPNGSSDVLTAVLKLIDKYDLYGHVAYPKHHKQPQVPEIYRLAAKTKGVFINPALVEPFGLTLIEAAAYGLPVVATKIGGPVDILKVLNNGLLIDPRDQKGTSDALLKLVADKNLWHECRKNGLKNIHRFSWTEHCRNYLYHVEQCRNQHATKNLLELPISEEPLSESLRGIEDLSLKFSLDVDVMANEELNAAKREQKLIEILLQRAPSSSNGNSSSGIYCPGKRQWIYVVAVDSYNMDGSVSEVLPSIIKQIKLAAELKSGRIGLILSTGMSLREIKDELSRHHVKLEEFDALVCKSGSEVYQPWRDLVEDQDYQANIEYRWPGGNVKSMVTSLARTECEEPDTNTVESITKECSSMCYTYSIKPGYEARKIEELKQRLRMRGIRCNVVYTHAASRLNVLPLLASRAQALRYLSVRWGINLSKMVVFVGERGDTDYDEMLGGVHRTVILKDSVLYASDAMLERSSNDELNMLSRKTRNIALCDSFEVASISKTLETFGNDTT